MIEVWKIYNNRQHMDQHCSSDTCSLLCVVQGQEKLASHTGYDTCMSEVASLVLAFIFSLFCFEVERLHLRVPNSSYFMAGIGVDGTLDISK